MQDVSAFVLAGGKSSRMGEDKAFLTLEGRTLLASAIEVASSLGPVRILGDPAKFAPYGDVIADIFPGQGPLAGIHAALNNSRSLLNLVLAVDMPFVTADLLRFLLRRARESGKTVTIARVNGRFQPLCAIYRRPFADVAEPALRANRNKIEPLFRTELTCIIEEHELVELAFSPAMFDNLNTRQEFERATSAVRERR